MGWRYLYVGGTLLLAAGCGGDVVLGHGANGGSSGNGSGATASGGSDGVGASGAADGDPGAGGKAGGATGLAGSPPLDNGPQARSGKVDLLIAVDNSISTGDKQRLFSTTVPELVERLVNPPCVNGGGAITSQPATPDAACPGSSQREFLPVRDMHVGVITTSLGSHGATGPRDVCILAEDDDHAHLLPFVRSGLSSYDGQGFLKWDPDGLASPAGESDVAAFAGSLQTMLGQVGEAGCGYEAQLESVYRFLVDPDPPLGVVVDTSNRAAPLGTDEALLEQRANFLRPDSSVAVLLLTDENDCSIVDEGYGWLIARADFMYRSTSQCLTNPNDACCQSCGESVANVGCPTLETDIECQKGLNLSGSGEDDLNLRCWEQKRRFGFDLLYPLARYTNGFGNGQVLDREGNLVDNPLFQSGGAARPRSLFTLAVIGGVPWQYLATDASLAGSTLEYMTPAQLSSSGRWPMIAGDPTNHVPPTDPFMLESVQDRSTLPGVPRSSLIVPDQQLVASSSDNPRANAINGHENTNNLNRDLQYSCTFQLPQPVVCDQALFESDAGCDCFIEDAAYNRPLCQPPGGGAASNTQYYGKAYPPLRELAVAEELGRRSVLGSVCSRNTTDASQPDYGYRPVFSAIGKRIAQTLLQP